MMRSRSFRSLCCCATLLSFLAGIAPLPAPAEVLQEITVKEGDTLWGVANYYLKDPRRWPDILKYNRLPSNDSSVILPGMKLRVPMLLIKEHLRAAHLVDIFNEVLFRRSVEADWKKAWKDMELYNEDGLRTLQQSKAKVKFPSGEMLQMDENSLIILKPERTHEEIDLLSGGVRASRTKVLTSSSMVDPRIEPRGPAPDFKTKLKEDKTTLVEVYEGIVDVTAQGKTVTLTKGFGTEVKFREAPSSPKALPPRPDMDVNAPAEMPGTNFSASGKVVSGALQLDIKDPAPRSGTGVSGSGSIEKPGSAAVSARPEEKKAQSQVLGQIISKYHVQVSTSHFFVSMVVDETLPLKNKVDIDFKEKHLPDGIYYYRVAYVDELGFEGQYSYPVQFTVDTTPPDIDLFSPENDDEIDTEFVHIEGQTEAGALLKVNDKSVVVDETGRFLTAILPPQLGKNVIILVAEDKAGNISREEVTIYRVKTATKAKVQKIETKTKDKGATAASIALGALTGLVIVGVLVFLFK